MLRILKKLKSTLFFVLLTLSLLANIGLLTSVTLYGIATSAIEAVVGNRNIALKPASEFAELMDNLDQQKRINRELQSELAETSANLTAERKAKRELRSEFTDQAVELATEKKINREIREDLIEANANLVIERKTKRELRAQLGDVSADLMTAKLARKQLKKKSRAISRKVIARAGTAGARATSTVAGKTIPFVGTVVVISATALEMADLCATVKDMYELQQMFDSTAAPSDEELTLCGWEPPSKEEIWSTVSKAPGEAWSTARDSIPSLEEMKSYELPDVDWGSVAENLQVSTIAAGKNTWDTMKTQGFKLEKWWNTEPDASDSANDQE